MLLTHEMIYSVLCAFQNRIKRLGGVVVRIAASKLLIPMIDPVVSGKQLADFAVAVKLIGHKMCSLVHKVFNVWHQIIEAVTFNRNSPNRTVALNGDQDSLLLRSAPAFVLDTIFIPRLASDVLFIQFNNAAKRWNQFRARIHHLSYRMAKFPCTFLGDANPFGQKNRGHSFAGVGDVVHSQQPLPKT